MRLPYRPVAEDIALEQFGAAATPGLRISSTVQHCTLFKRRASLGTETCIVRAERTRSDLVSHVGLALDCDSRQRWKRYAVISEAACERKSRLPQNPASGSALHRFGKSCSSVTRVGGEVRVQSA